MLRRAYRPRPNCAKATYPVEQAQRVHPIWHETFLPLGTPQPIPSCAGAERRLRAFALRNRDGVRGRPPFWPAGDPVAQSVACVRPTVSPPVRRPDVRGCSPSSVVGRQFRRFGRACQAPTSKPAARGWTAFMGSGCSSALSGRRGAAKSVSWSGAGGQRPTMWVFWADGPRDKPTNQEIQPCDCFGCSI